MVVIFEGHLKIETSELGQMPVGVGILSPEDGTNLVHLLHISGNGHLLGQLRRLGQECWATEIVDLEHSGTGLGGGGMEFRGLDLGEPLRIEECSEEVGNSSTKAEDGVGYRGTEIDNSVGEAGGLANTRIVGVGPGKLSKGTTGILDLEWKRSGGGSDYMKLKCVYEGTAQKDTQTTWFAECSYLLNGNLNFVD